MRARRGLSSRQLHKQAIAEICLSNGIPTIGLKSGSDSMSCINLRAGLSQIPEIALWDALVCARS